MKFAKMLMQRDRSIKNAIYTAVGDTLDERQMQSIEAAFEQGAKTWADAQARDIAQSQEPDASKIAELQQLIDKGLASGISTRSTSDVLAEAREKAKIALSKS